MAKSKTKESCFIIMPITTPEQLVERYKGDVDHFKHVLEELFIPALDKAGFHPIPPTSKGSNVIQAEIIKQLSSCELVLCDMSILNPNVFYEFGIRTALDKPVALVVDDKTKLIPFDTNILNYHAYNSSLEPWILRDQMPLLTKHVQDAYKKSKGNNALWKYFGVAQTGTFRPEEAELGEKIDLIMQELSTIKMEKEESEQAPDKRFWAQYTGDPLAGYKNVISLSSKLTKESIEDKLDRIHGLLQESLTKTAQKDKPQESDSDSQK